MIRVAVIMGKTVRAALNDWRWGRRLRDLRRADFVADAEEDSHRRLNRGLTAEELSDCSDGIRVTG